MKYFNLDLLSNSDDMSDTEWEAADKLWMENLNVYWDQFESYKDRLPARFVREYKKHAFHDHVLNSINYYNDGSSGINCSRVELNIVSEEHKFLLKYIGVTKYNININNIKYIKEREILYNEVLPVSDKVMSHEIMLDDKSSIYIEFRKVKLEIKLRGKNEIFY